MIEEITAKTILSTYRETDTWFGTKYSMNLYRGCQHGCIYCDSRSDCYQLGELSKIRVKTNAADLLRKELKAKKKKGTIGFGSMNDCYMPVELKLEYAKRALQIIANFEFPIHIITKSKYVTRDIELIKEISKVYAAVSFSVTSAEDKLAKKVEPGASLTSERFAAMKTLAVNGIYTGAVVMPILPFIQDNEENIFKLCRMAVDNGASYIIACFGMTCRSGQREYFYNKLNDKFPGTRKKYESTFGDSYFCKAQNDNRLYEKFGEFCEKYSIPSHMQFFDESKTDQLSMF